MLLIVSDEYKLKKIGLVLKKLYDKYKNLLEEKEKDGEGDEEDSKISVSD